VPAPAKFLSPRGTYQRSFSIFKPDYELSCRTGINGQMDERRTLQILAWTVGGLVGFMFVLNALPWLPRFDST
jgi:hypothetical protein